METQYISLNMTPTGVNPCFHISQYDVGRMLGFIVHSGGATVDLDTYTCTIEATRSDGTAITSAVATTDNIGTFEVTPTMSNKADKYRCQLIIVDENSKRIASLPFDMDVTKAAMDENSEGIEEDASLYQQYTEAVQGAIAEANADIQAEENARIAAVNAEATTRQNADATLQNNIDAEATARANAITAEATARQTADNTLQDNINSEASTRASADSNLQSQINQIVAPSGEAPSAAEVQNARIGADGVTYDTLGNAIRSNDNKIKLDQSYPVLDSFIDSDLFGSIVDDDVYASYTKLTGTLVQNKAWRTTGTPTSGNDYNYKSYNIPSTYKKNYLIISGHSWGEQFPLVCFYDASNNLLGKFGTFGNTRYEKKIIIIPENTSLIIINGDNRSSSYLEPIATTNANSETLSRIIFNNLRAYNTLITEEFITNNPLLAFVRNWAGGYCYSVGDTAYKKITDIPNGVTTYFSLAKLTTKNNRSTKAYMTYILANTKGIWLGWDNNTNITWYKLNDYTPLKISCSLTDITPTNTVTGKAKHTNGNEASGVGYLYCEYSITGGKTYIVSGYNYASTSSGGYSAYIVYDANDTVIDFGIFGTTGKAINHFEITVPNNATKMIINGITGTNNYILPLLQQYSDDFTVNDLYQKNKPRRYLFIGDSYLEGYSHDGNNSGWGIYCGNYMGLTENTDYVRKYYGGARFSANASNNTFLALLNDTAYPFDYFTDIVVCGGYNDHSYSESDILNGISAFITRAKTKYPNAKIHIGCVAYNKEGNGEGAEPNWETYRSQIINMVIPTYQKCVEYGAHYLNNVEYWLGESGLTPSDGYHPSEAGNRSIARALANALLTGSAPLPYNGSLRVS